MPLSMQLSTAATSPCITSMANPTSLSLTARPPPADLPVGNSGRHYWVHVTDEDDTTVYFAFNPVANVRGEPKIILRPPVSLSGNSRSCRKARCVTKIISPPEA